MLIKLLRFTGKIKLQCTRNVHYSKLYAYPLSHGKFPSLFGSSDITNPTMINSLKKFDESVNPIDAIVSELRLTIKKTILSKDEKNNNYSILLNLLSILSHKKYSLSTVETSQILLLFGKSPTIKFRTLLQKLCMFDYDSTIPNESKKQLFRFSMSTLNKMMEDCMKNSTAIESFKWYIIAQDIYKLTPNAKTYSLLMGPLIREGRMDEFYYLLGDAKLRNLHSNQAFKEDLIEATAIRPKLYWRDIRMLLLSCTRPRPVQGEQLPTETESNQPQEASKYYVSAKHLSMAFNGLIIAGKIDELIQIYHHVRISNGQSYLPIYKAINPIACAAAVTNNSQLIFEILQKLVQLDVLHLTDETGSTQMIRHETIAASSDSSVEVMKSLTSCTQALLRCSLNTTHSSALSSMETFVTSGRALEAMFIWFLYRGQSVKECITLWNLLTKSADPPEMKKNFDEKLIENLFNQIISVINMKLYVPSGEGDSRYLIRERIMHFVLSVTTKGYLSEWSTKHLVESTHEEDMIAEAMVPPNSVADVQFSNEFYTNMLNLCTKTKNHHAASLFVAMAIKKNVAIDSFTLETVMKLLNAAGEHQLVHDLYHHYMNSYTEDSLTASPSDALKDYPVNASFRDIQFETRTNIRYVITQYSHVLLKLNRLEVAIKYVTEELPRKNMYGTMTMYCEIMQECKDKGLFSTGILFFEKIFKNFYESTLKLKWKMRKNKQLSALNEVEATLLGHCDLFSILLECCAEDKSSGKGLKYFQMKQHLIAKGLIENDFTRLFLKNAENVLIGLASPECMHEIVPFLKMLQKMERFSFKCCNTAIAAAIYVQNEEILKELCSMNRKDMIFHEKPIADCLTNKFKVSNTDAEIEKYKKILSLKD